MVGRARLTPYLLLAGLLLGSGIGVGLVPQQAGSAGRPTVAVPHGWRPVSYGGVVLDVPGGWPTRPWTLIDTCTGSIGAPTVLLGPPPNFKVHDCLARSIPLAAVVNVDADVVRAPGVLLGPVTLVLVRAPGVPLGLVTLVDRMKPTEINGLRVDLTFARVSAQTPNFPRKRFVDLAYVYVPFRHLWVFVSVATSRTLPGGAPGRAMEIVHTIRKT